MLKNNVHLLSKNNALVACSPSLLPEAARAGGFFGSGLFSTNQRTRSRVAIESSTDECPDVPPPVWMDRPNTSRVLVEIQFS